MTIDRRELLTLSLSASAVALLPQLAQARAHPMRASDFPAETKGFQAAETAIPPRERLLFDSGWKFTFGHGTDPAKDLGFGFGQSDFSKQGLFKPAMAGFDDAAWRSVSLPHDWAVELPFVHDDSGQGDEQLRTHGYKPLGRRYPETSVGWYRRVFPVPASDAGRRVWVEFDGAMRDSLVFVNGCFVGRSTDGYTPFRFDLSDFLTYGGDNVIVVRVDASLGDGWFYEGAGLYRHAWLLKTDALHLERWASTVRARITPDGARLDLSAAVVNLHDRLKAVRAVWTIQDASGATVAAVETGTQMIDAAGSTTFTAATTLPQPELWSVTAPNLYTALIHIEGDGAVTDGERVTFGVRSLRFDADKGFFLNDQPLKIQGVCNHQDHAGVGAALPDALQAFRVGVMQSMGCNAIRTAHNMPTPELVEACDRAGVMLLCETRQMSSSPEGLAQFETMIRRYRNAPSVIMWSIGNEENALEGAMAEQGARIGRAMTQLCHELDPTRPVTAAVNADNEKGVSDAVDVIGFNYHREFPDDFHKRHPRRPVLATEDASDVSTRGEYVTDWSRNVVSCFDGDVPWKKSPENWWRFYAERDWTAGGFAWTGFDYRGEPSPFGWPSINSNFGLVDMCGFPKDYFYYYQAWWGRKPVLHLFPHWNWSGKDGQTQPVWVYTNLDEVELFVNGRSLGRQATPRLGHLSWQAVYAPGFVEARGYRAGRLVLSERRETTGAPVAIRLRADRATLRADGEDAALITVDALDARGRAVPTAQNRIAFKVTGATLIGVGNGDPNCLESDKAPRRSLYNGLAQVIIQAGSSPGDITLEAVSDDGAALKPARLSLRATTAVSRPAVATVLA
jgi:beta-galactosidase